MKFTTAHESGPKNPSEEKEMDLHNNGVGLNIGKTGGKRAANDALNGRCYVALSTGQLKVLKK